MLLRDMTLSGSLDVIDNANLTNSYSFSLQTHYYYPTWSQEILATWPKMTPHFKSRNTLTTFPNTSLKSSGNQAPLEWSIVRKLLWDNMGVETVTGVDRNFENSESLWELWTSMEPRRCWHFRQGNCHYFDIYKMGLVSLPSIIIRTCCFWSYDIVFSTTVLLPYLTLARTARTFKSWATTDFSIHWRGFPKRDFAVCLQPLPLNYWYLI